MPTISIDGRNMFYRDIGKGYPLLFGHSYLWSSKMWEPQIAKLSQKYRCICVDLWDHGQSEGLNSEHYTIEQLAEDHWNLMQYLEVNEFSMIGLSVGGMWGTHLALKHPDSVRTLTLMDTFVGAEPEDTKNKYFALLDFLEKQQCFTDPLLDQIVPLFFSPYTLENQPSLIDEFKNSLAQIKKENIPGIVHLGRAIFSRECLLDKLPQLHMPALVLTGKDDVPRPPAEAKMMASLIPNSEIHIIKNAGHISNLEQPKQITSLLENFLKKTEAVLA